MSKNPQIDTTKAFQTGSRAGENYVWLPSMGLAVGLALVIGLLSLILWEGLRVFWPRSVVQFELVDAKYGVGAKTVMAGEIVDHREKMNREIDKPAEHEYQLFIGNKDTYGANFKYLDAKGVKSESQPADV